MMNKFVVFLSLILFFDVANAGTDHLTVSLKVNQEVSVDNDNLIIRLVRIVEDCRCPVNVLCDWSGYVKAEIAVHIGTFDYGHHFIANIDNDYRNLSSKIRLDKYTLKLGFTAVSPERIHNWGKEGIAKIKKEYYAVELSVGYM